MKDFESEQYWDHFGRGLLKPEERPTTQEAADYIISLKAKLDAKDREVSAAKKSEKIAKQQFEVFLMEVGNVARKYQI